MNDQSSPSPAQRSLLPSILHGYVVVFQIAIVILLFVLYHDHPRTQSSLASLAPRGFSDPVTNIIYGVGVVAFALAFLLPQLLLGRGRTGSPLPLGRVMIPYIIRICLFETCAICGFIIGFLTETWEGSLPLVLLGLIGAVMSMPTTTFFERFRGA